jgi:hypothetical protein
MKKRTYEVIEKDGYFYFPETGNKYSYMVTNGDYIYSDLFRGGDISKAIKLEKTNKNCFNCTDIKCCINCNNSSEMYGCVDCNNCSGGTRGDDPYDPRWQFYGMRYSSNCTDCEGLVNCDNCNNTTSRRNCNNCNGVNECYNN